MPEEEAGTRKTIALTKPYLVVCEGAADKAFLERLLKVHQLTEFQVESPDKGGITDYGRFLGALTLARGFENLSAIILTTDNDSRHNNPFHRLQQQIRQAEAGYPVPTEPLVPSRVEGFPPLIAVMIPWGERRGNLEVLILDAFSNKWPELRASADEYRAASPANDWSEDKCAIMILQCMIAALCQQSPNCSVTHIWSRPEFRPLL